MRLLATCAIALSVIALLAALVKTVSGTPGPTDEEVRAAAIRWVGAGVAEEPRRDGDEWEVDVVRPDGSLVEVTIGDELELRETDEELTATGDVVVDKIAGSLRRRAVEVALAKVGSGQVIGVERDKRDGEIEVEVVREGDVIEVGLTPSLRVIEVEKKDVDDE